MSFISVTDIREILEPTTRYLFLDCEGVVEACLIRSVFKDSVLVYHQSSPFKSKTPLKGFFVAASGRGIVQFHAQCQREKGIKSALALYRVAIDLPGLVLVNRRVFIRHAYERPVPILFEFEGKPVKARLVNISEGGLRMDLNDTLPSNVVFEFQLTLPRKKGPPFKFHTDGLVIYCTPEDDPRHFVAGIAFVAPRFRNEEERDRFKKESEGFKKYLVEEFEEKKSGKPASGKPESG